MGAVTQIADLDGSALLSLVKEGDGLMAYNVYSFQDVKAVLNHADVGQCNLHQSGMGKITVSSAGDVVYIFLAATISEQ